MKVICSGMPKTGTKSLAAALRILGYKVYDFEEQYFYIGEDLIKIMEGGWTNENIQRIFKDVDAVTDIPGNMLWEDLLQAFPDAKVVHTERSSEENWYKSLVGQIDSMKNNIAGRLLVNLSPSGRRLRQFLSNALVLAISCVDVGVIGVLKLNKQYALMRYRQHNTKVKTVVPGDQLLLFKLSDGWKPLCEFLNKPIPDKSFPHRNKGGSITQEIVDDSYIFDPIKKEVKLVITGITVFLGLLLYFCFLLL